MIGDEARERPQRADAALAKGSAGGAARRAMHQGSFDWTGTPRSGGIRRGPTMLGKPRPSRSPILDAGRFGADQVPCCWRLAELHLRLNNNMGLPVTGRFSAFGVAWYGWLAGLARRVMSHPLFIVFSMTFAILRSSATSEFGLVLDGVSGAGPWSARA